jgi:hypothetical protein
VNNNFQVEITPTLKEIASRFSLAEKNLGNDREAQAETLAADYLRIARKQAPKKSGDFANSLQTETFRKGVSGFGFNFFEPQPLGKWIRLGTKPHKIVPKGAGYPLAFYWAKIGGMMYTYSVNHPGTKPNPYAARAEREWRGDAEKTNQRISTRYVNMIAKGRAI